MRRGQRDAATARRPVRVTRNGNARTLTVPIDIVSAAHVEVGDLYTVEEVDGDLLYRRVDRERAGRPRGYFVGEGHSRTFILPKGASFPAGPDPSPTLPIDWDY